MGITALHIVEEALLHWIAILDHFVIVQRLLKPLPADNLFQTYMSLQLRAWDNSAEIKASFLRAACMEVIRWEDIISIATMIKYKAYKGEKAMD